MKNTKRFGFLVNLLVISFILVLQTAEASESLVEETKRLSYASLEKKLFYKELSRYWAPMIYHDCSIEEMELEPDEETGEKRKIETLAVEDAMIGRNFDGDCDMRNNARNIVKVKKDESGNLKAMYLLQAKLDYAVRETESHYYIFYSLYHAIDGNPTNGHAQDSESILLVIRKQTWGSEMGHFEFAATNFHGYAKIYALDSDLQERLRERTPAPDFFTSLAYNHVDKHAKDHNSGSLEFMINEETREPQTFKFFVCRSKHAIFKCNEEKWKDGKGEGYIYSCQPEGQGGDYIDCYPIRPEKERNIGYELVDFDRDYLETFPVEIDSLTAEMHENAERQYHMAYDGLKGYWDRKERLLPNGRTIEIKKIASHYAKGLDDDKPEANTFYAWRFKTEFDTRDVAALHAYLLGYDPNDPSSIREEEISQVYIYNPHVKYID